PWQGPLRLDGAHASADERCIRPAPDAVSVPGKRARSNPTVAGRALEVALFPAVSAGPSGSAHADVELELVLARQETDAQPVDAAVDGQRERVHEVDAGLEPVDREGALVVDLGAVNGGPIVVPLDADGDEQVGRARPGMNVAGPGVVHAAPQARSGQDQVALE